MADPVEKLKKKMLEKLREAGAPETAIEAVDFLSPDDITDLGITAAASLIPGGAIAKGATKIAKGAAKTGKAIKGAVKKGAEGAISAIEKAPMLDKAAVGMSVPASYLMGKHAIDKSEKAFQEIEAIQNKYKQEGEDISWETASALYAEGERAKFEDEAENRPSVESSSKYRGQKRTK